MVAFVESEVNQTGDHTFGIYNCGPDHPTLVDELSEMVRELYLDSEELSAALAEAASGLESVVDPSYLDELLSEIGLAVIPAPASNPNKPRHLDLARNEVAEVLAIAAAHEVLGAIVPAERIRNKEVGGQPARGIDLLAFVCEPTLTLVLSEVKASSSADSPPSVVDTGHDCLRTRLTSLVGDRSRLMDELNWAFKHCRAEAHKKFISEALIKLGMELLPTIVFPVLVRPATVCQGTDFGQLLVEPEQVSPARVHFCIASIEGTLEELAGAVYSKARAADDDD